MIRIKNVTCTYMDGGPFEKVAVKDVNLEIRDGEFIGLMGHTGSGKSTLIQMIAGLIKPTGGEIEIDGQVLHSKGCDMRAMRFKTGIVMQYPEYQLFEETVFSDIAFGPTNMGLNEDEVKKRVENAAMLAGVKKELLEKSPFDLSGGQKRRVAIAGILAMEPSVLILDEPTAGLDPAGRRDILDKIRELHKKMGITVIFVSHSMEDIARMADRIVVMNEGSIDMTGTVTEIFAKPERLREIGLSVPQITEICEKLRERGVPLNESIYTLEFAKAELEELILKKRKSQNQ